MARCKPFLVVWAETPVPKLFLAHAKELVDESPGTARGQEQARGTGVRSVRQAAGGRSKRGAEYEEPSPGLLCYGRQ